MKLGINTLNRRSFKLTDMLKKFSSENYSTIGINKEESNHLENVVLQSELKKDIDFERLSEWTIRVYGILFKISYMAEEYRFNIVSNT